MLSKRLSCISELVPQDTNVADIGSDHGYLLISLRERDFKGKLLGVENKKGPFNSLQKNIKSSKYSDSVSISLSDGLDNVTSEFNTIVIAGMGFDSIKSIVEKNINKIFNIDHFLIDSHTKTYETRNFFVKLGYSISKEIIIEEEGVFYEIILFKKGKTTYSETELKYGPFLLKERNDVFVKKYTELLNKNKKVLANLKPGTQRYNELNLENESINSILNN